MGQNQNITTKGLAVDTHANCVLAAIVRGTAKIGNITLTSKGDQAPFLLKVDSLGRVLWAKAFDCD